MRFRTKPSLFRIHLNTAHRTNNIHATPKQHTTHARDKTHHLDITTYNTECVNTWSQHQCTKFTNESHTKTKTMLCAYVCVCVCVLPTCCSDFGDSNCSNQPCDMMAVNTKIVHKSKQLHDIFNTKHMNTLQPTLIHT